METHPYERLKNQFFKLIDCHEVGKLSAYCMRKGLTYNTLKCWRNGQSRPSLQAFVEALDKSGYVLQIVSKRDYYK